MAAVAHLRARLQVQARQRVVHAREALRIAVEGEHVQVGELQEVRGLAAGGGAGVQHARARRQAGAHQQVAGALGGGVLHRDGAVGEAGQAVDRHRGGEHDGLGVGELAGQAGGLELLQVLRTGELANVHAQAHRRAHLGGGGDGLPSVRPVGAQAVDPPLRMIPLAGGLFVGGGHQRGALADEAAQHGVEERGRLRHALAGGGDGLVDERVVGIRRRVVGPQQRDGAQQQCLDGRRRRARRHDRANGLRGAEPAQHEKRQRLRARAQRPGQAASTSVSERPHTHGLHGVGRLFEQARQRRGLGGGAGASGRERSHAEAI